MGNLLSHLLQSIIPIPGSIYGMIGLFILLSTGVLKIEMVEDVGEFLLKHMGLFFIPLGVSLMTSLDLVKNVWLELLIGLVISCFIVMLVTSKVTEIVIRFKEGKR
jgi:holin-like protein